MPEPRVTIIPGLRGFAKIKDALVGEGGLFGYKGPFWKLGEAVTYPFRAVGIAPTPPGEPLVGIPRMVQAGEEFIKDKSKKLERLAADLMEKIPSKQDVIDIAKAPLTPIAEALQKIEMPKLEVKMPEIKMPEIKMPEIRMPAVITEVRMPELRMPAAPTVPTSLLVVSALGGLAITAAMLMR